MVGTYESKINAVVWTFIGGRGTVCGFSKNWLRHIIINRNNLAKDTRILRVNSIKVFGQVQAFTGFEAAQGHINMKRQNQESSQGSHLDQSEIKISDHI